MLLVMNFQRCTIIVSGFQFETTESCLNRYPETLLGNPERRNHFFDVGRNAYFFDRHRLAFEGILMYYQCYGRIACPENVPTEVFEAELAFFEIDCELRQNVAEAKKYVLEQIADVSRPVNIREQIWRILHNPASSKGAQILSSVSLVLTIASIALACIETSHHHNA